MHLRGSISHIYCRALPSARRTKFLVTYRGFGGVPCSTFMALKALYVQCWPGAAAEPPAVQVAPGGPGQQCSNTSPAYLYVPPFLHSLELRIQGWTTPVILPPRAYLYRPTGPAGAPGTRPARAWIAAAITPRSGPKGKFSDPCTGAVLPPRSRARYRPIARLRKLRVTLPAQRLLEFHCQDDLRGGYLE